MVMHYKPEDVYEEMVFLHCFQETLLWYSAMDCLIEAQEERITHNWVLRTDTDPKFLAESEYPFQRPLLHLPGPRYA